MTDTHHTASTMIAEIADLREKLRVAEAAREEAERLADRRWKERADVLHVMTKEGLTCSEWLLRTGVAERERDSLAALVGEIKHSHRGCSIAPIPAPAALEALTRRIRGEVETNLALWTDERVKTFRAGVERLTRAEVWREAAKFARTLFYGTSVKYFTDECERRAKGEDEQKYPCAKCGKLRTKAEGGTTFTVCDACWDGTPRRRAAAEEGK